MAAERKSKVVQEKISVIGDINKRVHLYNKFIETLNFFEKDIDNKPVNCFLSHTWSNGQHLFAKYLVKRLNKFKRINCWLDEENLNFGDHIYDRIDMQLSLNTDVAIILLSPEYLLSHNCKVELSKANKLYASNKILLLPILLAKTEIPLELDGLLFADFTDCFSKKNKLVKRNIFDKKLEKLVASIIKQS